MLSSFYSTQILHLPLSADNSAAGQTHDSVFLLPESLASCSSFWIKKLESSTESVFFVFWFMELMALKTNVVSCASAAEDVLFEIGSASSAILCLVSVSEPKLEILFKMSLDTFSMVACRFPSGLKLA
jgi:hypothetical protein